jgi:hypothetical protein
MAYLPTGRQAGPRLPSPYVSYAQGSRPVLSLVALHHHLKEAENGTLRANGLAVGAIVAGPGHRQRRPAIYQGQGTDVAALYAVAAAGAKLHLYDGKALVVNHSRRHQPKQEPPYSLEPSRRAAHRMRLLSQVRLDQVGQALRAHHHDASPLHADDALLL